MENELSALLEKLTPLQAVAAAATKKVRLMKGLERVARVLRANHTNISLSNSSLNSSNSSSNSTETEIESADDDDSDLNTTMEEPILGACKNGSCWTSPKKFDADADAEKPTNPELNVDDPVMVPVATSTADDADAVNYSAIPDMLPADPNMDDNTTNIASRSKKLKKFLVSNTFVLDQLAEQAEVAESPLQKEAVKNATQTAVVGLLNRVNDLLTICVDDNSPMNLPFAEYVNVMRDTLQNMLKVVQAAKRNGIKL
jgi:hypothetical protein